MKRTIGLGLVFAVALASTASSARQGQLRPTPSQNGPLEVTIKDDVSLDPKTAVEINPGRRWPMNGNASSVWVTGSTPVQWSYEYVCLAGPPDRWVELTKRGQEGWELVGPGGVSCIQGNVTGGWFILKRPGQTLAK